MACQPLSKVQVGMLSDSVSWVQGFLRNNGGIDDGADLPEAYMSDLYDRIVNNEIKMKVRCQRYLRGQSAVF